MSIPIIGQPKIGDWFFTVQITCSCGHSMILAGQPGTFKICPCLKAYRMMGMPTLNPLGEIQVPLAMGEATPAQPTTVEPPK
jgi:hypothetical protein